MNNALALALINAQYSSTFSEVVVAAVAATAILQIQSNGGETRRGGKENK
jgi:hypothetical protein